MTTSTWGLGMCEPTRKRKTATPESIVLKAVTAYLKLCRLGPVTRNNVGMIWTGGRPGSGRPMKFGTPGEADLTLELTGTTRCVHVEVKAPKGRLSPLQAQWLDSQRQRGHLCVVAFSVSDVYEALTAAGFTVPVPGGRKRTPLKEAV